MDRLLGAQVGGSVALVTSLCRTIIARLGLGLGHKTMAIRLPLQAFARSDHSSQGRSVTMGIRYPQ